MIAACPDDFNAGKFVQAPADFVAENFSGINSLMYQLLDRLIEISSRSS